MILGLDFDGTYAADPDFFDDVVTLARTHGHEVVMVTQRGSAHAYEIESLTDKQFPIVYAAGQKKAEAAREAGYPVDVWIDDEPIGVYVERTYMGAVLAKVQ